MDKLRGYRYLDRNKMEEIESSFSIFQKLMVDRKNYSVVDLGSRKNITTDTHAVHKMWVPNASKYIGSDYRGGENVDIVADIHCLSKTLGADSFDVIICEAVLEHVAYPWIAAKEIAKVLKIGGIAYIETHQTFILHGYPDDYWRYSESILKELFGPKVGLNVVHSSYLYPARISSEHQPGLGNIQSGFLNVCLVAEKIKNVDEVVWFKGD